MDKPAPKLLTISEVAIRLGISTRSVRRLVKRQELTVVRLSARLVRITPAAMSDFLRRADDDFA